MMDGMTTDSGIRRGFWARSHHLNRMTLAELVRAYFQYPAIQAYLALSVAAIAVAVAYPASWAQTLAAIATASLIYPLAWYGIHRYILHGKWMFKSPLTARMWKRVHYDHHQDPNHLEVLFGALVTTLPTVAIATAFAGWAIGGVGGAAAGFATGLLTTCLYEFIHCIQHLGVKPKNAWLAELKRRHMEHHFHDERGNYGIAAFWPDRLFGSLYERADRPARSPHVFNLGYDAEAAARWPWVAELTGGVEDRHPRQREAQEA
jgi:sterol desaturase/sphingolipid hydroxylase (fatty acid hydroxylase superfamily)